MPRLAVLAALVLAALPTFAGCASTEVDDADDVEQHARSGDPLKDRISEIFLVEAPNAAVSSKMLASMRERPPGGIVFWNIGRDSAAELRDTVVRYSTELKNAGNPPILFSTDYEGGGASQTTRWASVPGIQRFTDGTTPLVHPRWIGAAYAADPARGRELARLHGQILAREMRSMGLNYPLAVVSDLAEGLFANRGVDRDPEITGALMREVLAGAATEPSVVFVTKHFPGLGQTRGDTHDEMVVSPVTDPAQAERHLAPFRAVVKYANDAGRPMSLSVMCSHAKFPAYDDELNTTVSPKLLGDVLRDDVGFRGLALSDAMWMGPYGHMGNAELMRVYARTFLAGMDMLMIPGAKSDAALAYFTRLYDATLPAADKEALARDLGTTFEDVRARFVERLRVTQARMDATRGLVGYAHERVDAAGSAPRDATTALRARYAELLEATDARWRGRL